MGINPINKNSSSTKEKNKESVAEFLEEQTLLSLLSTEELLEQLPNEGARLQYALHLKAGIEERLDKIKCLQQLCFPAEGTLWQRIRRLLHPNRKTLRVLQKQGRAFLKTDHLYKKKIEELQQLKTQEKKRVLKESVAVLKEEVSGLKEKRTQMRLHIQEIREPFRSIYMELKGLQEEVEQDRKRLSALLSRMLMGHFNSSIIVPEDLQMRFSEGDFSPLSSEERGQLTSLLNNDHLKKELNWGKEHLIRFWIDVEKEQSKGEELLNRIWKELPLSLKRFF